jgi:hypothetical protein
MQWARGHALLPADGGSQLATTVVRVTSVPGIVSTSPHTGRIFRSATALVEATVFDTIIPDIRHNVMKERVAEETKFDA